MKRPVAFYMLLIMASIFLFFFLNLVLGSVSIPLRAVWNILGEQGMSLLYGKYYLEITGTTGAYRIGGGGGALCQRFTDADCFPQSFGRSVGTGHQFGSQYGSCFCGASFGQFGWCCFEQARLYGGNSPYHSSYCRFTFHYGTYCLRFPKVRGNVTLLIIGVMIGYIANAVIGVLKFFSVEEDIRAYVIWGLGSFARVSGNQMTLFICIMVVLLPLSFLLVKTLNLLLLGDAYARNLGLNIKRARLLVITCSGVLVAIVTAYCGPIIFLGLAVPHLCRGMFRTSDHRILMPASLLAGASLALVCNLIARMPGFEGALPVNSVTALVGAPVVMSVLFNKRRNEMNE